MFTTMTAVAILGGIFLVGAALLWLFASPVPKGYDRTRPDAVAADGG